MGCRQVLRLVHVDKITVIFGTGAEEPHGGSVPAKVGHFTSFGVGKQGLGDRGLALLGKLHNTLLPALLLFFTITRLGPAGLAGNGAG
jgi:hypothetical protein